MVKAPAATSGGMLSIEARFSTSASIATLQEFKAGTYNVLVATSVGEDGLDIAEVDLVVFFEAVPSEIRAVQRRDRTGRRRDGRVGAIHAFNKVPSVLYDNETSPRRTGCRYSSKQYPAE